MALYGVQKKIVLLKAEESITLGFSCSEKLNNAQFSRVSGERYSNIRNVFTVGVIGFIITH